MNPVSFIRDYCDLDLRPFQVDWLEELFREDDGERVYSQALWGVPRGNGKTELAAAVALYMLVADTRRAEVYIAAGSRDQASLAFKAARRMVEGGRLEPVVRVLPGYRRMHVPRTDSSLHVISADGPLQHGLQPTCVIFDELWVQKKRDLFEALAGGLFKRDRALLVCISTAGYDAASLLAEECARGEAGEDPRFFYRWDAAPSDLPHSDPETWRRANPALACERPFMRLEGLQDDLKRMHESEFRRWHLNQWTPAEDAWMSAQLWDACDAPAILLPDRDTILGIDASIRHDMTIVATVQRDEQGAFNAIFRGWGPEREIDLGLVMAHVRQQTLEFKVTGVAYDPQYMHHAAQTLEDEGIPMVEWRQDNAQPLDEPTLTPSGWRPIGSLQVGDEVIGSDGAAVPVIGVRDWGLRPVHEVLFSDGARTRCTANHLWRVATADQRSHGRAGRVRSLAEIMDEGLTQRMGDKDGSRHFVPLVAVQGADRPLPIDPYVLGALLGDGSFGGHSVQLSSSDPEIVEMVAAGVPDDVSVKSRGGQWHSLANAGHGCRGNSLTRELRRLDLWGVRSPGKSIPEEYLLGSQEQRLSLLRGLMDTDGTVSGRSAYYYTTAPGLRDGVVALARSLGGVGRVYRVETPPPRRPLWRVAICLPAPLVPFALGRKAERYGRINPPHRAIASIREVGVTRTRCISVGASDGLYVTRDYVLTHNSRMVPATRTLHEAVVHRRLRHGGDQLARSHALAAGVAETERGLRLKKTEVTRGKHMDAMVALAMAVDWASRTTTTSRSVYESYYASA